MNMKVNVMPNVSHATARMGKFSVEVEIAVSVKFFFRGVVRTEDPISLSQAST